MAAREDFPAEMEEGRVAELKRDWRKAVDRAKGWSKE